MTEVNPLYFKPNAAAPSVMDATHTIPLTAIPAAALVTSNFTATVPSAVVGSPVQKTGATFAIATNTVADAEIVGIVTAINAGVSTVSYGVIRNWAHGLSLTANRFWLGNGTLETTEPTVPANGRKVILGIAIDANTFLFNPRQIQQG